MIVPRGPSKHILLEKNPEIKTGVCITCGNVEIKYRKSLDGWRCKNGMKSQKGNALTTIASKQRRNAKAMGHGIFGVAYDEMVKQQNNCCAICGKSPDENKRLSVDHCHVSGKVRGLLCGSCNLGLGCFSDNPDSLLKAVEYLRQGKVSRF